MRRISLALALVGAVAAAGCGGAGGTSPASSGGNKGVDQASFKLVVVGEGTPTWDAATSTTVVIPKGGVVTGGGINCGVDGTGAHTTCQVLIPYNTTAVALTATPLAPYAVWGWAGACGGTGACSVVMTDTRTIAIRFATSTAGLGAHPPFTDPAIHGPEWMKNFQSPVPAGTYTCSASNCHGPQLLGVALAPACNKCHMMPHTGAASYGTYGQTTHPADYATAALLSAGSQNCFDCHSGTNFMGAKTAGLAPGAPYLAPACFSCHTTFDHNSYTHPAAYEGEFYSGGRTGYTPGFVGSFANTYTGPALTGALPLYGSWAAGADTWEPNCAGCHGQQVGGKTDLVGYPNGAPACDECHYKPPMPEVLGNGLSNHFTATKEAWSLYSFSQACERCHTAGGYKAYVGVTGSGTNLVDTFLTGAVGPAGTQGMVNGGNASGPLSCDVCHNPVTDPSRDGLHGAWVAGITTIEFPSLIKIGGLDKGRGLCGTCHQARQATANLVSAIASKWQDALGVTYTSLSANAASVDGTTLVFKNLNMAAVPTPVVPGVGYTAVFNGNATAALNGQRAIVSAVSAPGATNTTITFASALPAAPNFVWVACVAASGTNTTCMTTQGGATPVTVPGTGWAKTWDSATFYPTATGGTTTTLVDANRGWTNGQWIGWFVFFQTGANAGKYAAITANDATSLTFAAVSAPVAGDFYQIVQESPALADEILWADASHATTVATNNPHYLGAVATEYGSLAAGWYQFPGKSYRGSHTHTHLTKNVFDPETGATVTVDRTPTGTPIKVAAATCVDCHDAHTLEINQNACVGCHTQGTEAGVEANKLAKNDFDGDGVITTNKAEIESVKRTLWTAIKTYSKLLSASQGTAICFDNATNAYWFISSASDLTPGTDGSCVDGTGAATTCCKSNNAWGAKVTGTVTEATGMSPRLYRATYNYKFAMKDPGAWVHNPRYVAQVLIDNIVDLNAGITALGGTPVPFNPAGRP